MRFSAVIQDKFAHFEVWCSNYRETFAHFCTCRKKWAYPADYLITCFTNVDQISSFGSMWEGTINLMFVLRSLKGCCYGNQLIWEAYCKRQKWLPLVFTLAFQNINLVWASIQLRFDVGQVYSRHWSALELIHLCLLGVACLCCYCSLGDNTALPGGLHTVLCHASLVDWLWNCMFVVVCKNSSSVLKEMTWKLEKKSFRWKYVESLEPPRVVHVRTTEMLSKENVYAQVTVRLLTTQVDSILFKNVSLLPFLKCFDAVGWLTGRARRKPVQAGIKTVYPHSKVLFWNR